MSILVTGGAGFIGCNLVRRLIADGKRVRVFDNFSTGKRDNLALILSGLTNHQSTIADQLEIVEGDLRDFDILEKAMQGIDIVFHLAALPSVYRSIVAPHTTNNVNITGTLNILQAARTNGIKRVVYASSSSIYGNAPGLPKTEAMLPEPLSPYAVSKLAGEHYCRSYSYVYGLETITLRYFNVYGPYQDPSSEYSGVIAKFINAFLTGKPLTVYGDGEQSRDFTYVDDVVEANMLAAQAQITGEVFNVADGQRFSLNRMIEILKAIFEKNDYPVNYTNAREGDVRHSQADITRIKQQLGFNAKISFAAGLRRTVDWYQSNRLREKDKEKR